MMTRQILESELQELETKVLAMASIVEGMVAEAVEALWRNDMKRAEQVLRRDDEVDQIDVEIESNCLRLIALQQPMGSDLRTIGTIMKMITDIERIGDYAVDIAKAARKLRDEPPVEQLVDIPRLANATRRMLLDSIEAYVKRDLQKVIHVCQQDDEVDEIYRRIRTQLQEIMRAHPEQVTTASWLLLVAHYLERIADHATNIAERVWFMETGRLEQLAKKHKSGALEEAFAEAAQHAAENQSSESDANVVSI
ncbi:MAG: phosphate signaling complex protein PhoU [Fimbriimonadales bacterium]|nr:phosphate signaling complex protein PhoU [Fimbriimonadales bacterium]